MAHPLVTTYHEDSDADDEYERSLVGTPIDALPDSDGSDTESERQSSEHTPTFNNHGDDTSLPRTIITEWTAEESAQFISTLGLRQYCDVFIENDIVGEALIALKHDELKEMGISSVGHRLTILKNVYDAKTRQGVPVDPDHYVPPSAEQTPQLEMATKDDIARLAKTIMKLRDDHRIAAAEAQLLKLADDYRKLRQELLPVFKMAKERSEPLPYAPDQSSIVTPELTQQDVSTPPVTQTLPTKSSLTRTFSKKLFLGGAPKNNSPTHLPSAIPEGRALADGPSLDPSAAATSASNQLTASMSGGSIPQNSPNTISVPSPTSPPYAYQYPGFASRSYVRDGGLTPGLSFPRYDVNDDLIPRSSTVPPPRTQQEYDGPLSANSLKSGSTKPQQSHSLISNASTLVPSTHSSMTQPQSQPTSAASGGNATAKSSAPNGGDSAASVEIFKSFRVALEDPCYKVLPAALRKYNIHADWRQYALYIVYGDQERCVGLEEKPLALFKDLDRDGKKPMFMLRKLQGGPPDTGTIQKTGQGGGAGGAGLMSSNASIRTMGLGPGANLPGGVL